MKNVKLYLNDVIESIERIEDYVGDKDKEEFQKDPLLQDGVIRRLEIIGEAVKSIPKDLKKEHPTVPWRDVAGTRDVLIHDYAGVKVDLVWKIITRDIPKLKKNIKSILQNMD